MSVRWGWNLRHWGSMFGIIRQTSWYQTVTFVNICFKVNEVGYKIKNLASYQITWLVWVSLLSTSVFQFISSRHPQRWRNKKDAGREKTVRKAANVTTGSTVDHVKNNIILIIKLFRIGPVTVRGLWYWPEAYKITWLMTFLLINLTLFLNCRLNHVRHVCMGREKSRWRHRYWLSHNSRVGQVTLDRPICRSYDSDRFPI